MSTYSVASGLWTSMISLGAFIGPSLGGILYDHVGFREGSYLILVTSLVVVSTFLCIFVNFPRMIMISLVKYSTHYRFNFDSKGVTILIHTCVTSSDRKSDSESQPLLQPTPISPLLGKKDMEESQAAKPSMSYGSTTQTGGGDAAV